MNKYFACVLAVATLTGCGHSEFCELNPIHMGAVSYAIKDIRKGEMIFSDAIVDGDAPEFFISKDALTSSSIAIGRIAREPIHKGTMVLQHQLEIQEMNLSDRR